MQSTFPIYNTPCDWTSILPPRCPHSPIDRNQRVRFAIIGAGYTGLAAARRLAELFPADQIMLLEASRIDEGSSGRNSGFMLYLPHNARSQSLTHMVQNIKLLKAGRDYLKSLLDKHTIPCSWNPAGKYYAAATEHGTKTLKAEVANIRESGEVCEELDPDALTERLGSNYYSYGFYSPHCIFVQPAALVRGLADSLPDNVRLYENSPVLKLTAGKPHLLETSSGTIQAECVVIANNAFLKKLGYLKDRLIAI